MNHPLFVARSTSALCTLATALAASCLAAGLVACDADDDAATQSTGSVVDDTNRMDTRLLGAWRVLGEGTLLEITRGGATQFQQGTSLCYVDEALSTDNPADLVGVTFDGRFDGARATVDLYELAGTPVSSRLERIPEIPAACRAKPSTSPAATFKALCELMALDYAFFAERKIDWPARCAALAPRAAAAADADAIEAILIDALAGFDDAHVKLYRGEAGERVQVFSAANSPTLRMLRDAFAAQTEEPSLRAYGLAWRDRVSEQMLERLADTSGPQLDGAMVWGLLPGNIGYIGLARMKGFAENAAPADDVRLVRAAMDRAVAALAGTKALIVDVSLNGGGLDAVSAEIAGSFADQRRLAFAKTAHRPEGRPAADWFIEPKGLVQYRRPVYLLTSDLTGSAAETFTLMMRELPHVVHAGQATAGAISDVLEKALPGGFAVSFSNERDTDPRGVLYEAIGIPPRLPLRLFDPSLRSTLFDGHAAAVSALAEIAGR